GSGRHRPAAGRRSGLHPEADQHLPVDDHDHHVLGIGAAPAPTGHQRAHQLVEHRHHHDRRGDHHDHGQRRPRAVANAPARPDDHHAAAHHDHHSAAHHDHDHTTHVGPDDHHDGTAHHDR